MATTEMKLYSDEIRRLLETPESLTVLVDYHDERRAIAEASGGERVANWHRQRVADIRALRSKVETRRAEPDAATIVSAYRDAEGWILSDSTGEPVEWPASWPNEINIAFLRERGIKIGA